MFIILSEVKRKGRNIKEAIGVHFGVIGVHVVSMQNPLDGHVGNLNMTGDNLYTGTGIVMYQIHHSLLVVWRSYTSLLFLFVHDEGFAVGQSLVQAHKEDVAASLLLG
ncbi:uncharacterized protein TNCV_1110851 [Trichonephila clavipes]|nr:uncharacterized protein TNCV_1110851 [Trichonephila clavipes]